ncbi:MAG: amidohydrolase family protein [Armatimonadota bacterium]
MFDVSVGCGSWAMRPTPPSDAGSLEAMLRAEGITGACGYSLEAWFWPDPQEANELRLPELAASGFFVPSAVLNPTLPGWRRGYELCRERWQVPLVRLMPGYHAYELADPAVDALAERAARDGVVLGVHLRAEDERMQNPIALVAGVPFTDVVALAQRHPGLRVIAFGLSRLRELADFVPEGLLGRLNAPPESEPLAALPGNLWIDLSFFEYESSLVVATKLFRTDRLLFATHAPLFYPRCNVLKVRNSEAPADVKAAVTEGNARALLGVPV